MKLPASHAVKSRKDIFTQEIERVVENNVDRRGAGSGTVEITTLACGSAREVHDFLQKKCEQADQELLKVNFHLVDHDQEALDHVTEWKKEMDSSKNVASDINLYNMNPLKLCLGKASLDIPPQDLVYSIGVLDYFNDKVAIRFLNFIYDKLRPGGRVVLGNFLETNPTRGLMDTVLDWHLHHRTEDDMNRLFQQSKFSRPCTEFIYGEQGVQLLACCEK